MSFLTVPLDSPGATLELTGGKAANLSRLARASFPVPPGFVISTVAYDRFVAAGAIGPVVEQALAAMPGEDPAAYEVAPQTIRQAFQGAAIPVELAAEVTAAYRDLGKGAVAVRSSATAEDLPEASFAGQQETYLNVCGEGQLLADVRRCWSSLWTARAMAYRSQQGIPPTAARLAVVIQRMVPAEAAGVLFTVDPVTGDPAQVVINAAWGLGEAIVGGRVSPDTVVVDKLSGRLLRVEPGEKAVMTVPTADGTAEVEVDPERRRRQVLSAEQAAELARLGREIEAYFGGPQDIEWAISGEGIAILQARPVTVPGKPRAQDTGERPVPPGDDDWPAYEEHPPQPLDLWTRFNAGENFPNLVVPLAWSNLPRLQREMLLTDMSTAPAFRSIQWLKRFYGRPYINEGALLYLYNREFGFPSLMVAESAGLTTNKHFQPISYGFRPLALLRGLPRFLRASSGDATRELPVVYERIDACVAESETEAIPGMSDGDLLALLEVWLSFQRQVYAAFMAATNRTAFTMTPLGWLAKLFRVDREGLILDLVSGLSGVTMAEVGPALWDMAQALRDRGLDQLVLSRPPVDALAELQRIPAAQAVLVQLAAFLKRHGHHCINEAEIERPRWIEAPEQVIELIAGYLRAGEAANPHKAERRQRERREEAVAYVEGRLDPLRRRVFRRQLEQAQASVRCRDNTRYHAVKLFLVFRRGDTELGRRYAGRGWIEEPDDIYFLAMQEIEAVINAGTPACAGLDLRAIVAARRQAYSFWRNFREPEAIDWQGKPITVAERASGNVLRGIAASGGQARGPARLVSDPAQARTLRPGEILVTRATDPGWTPVFPLIAGLVFEVGGQLSHGAIVAREYGVPAVVNVKEAMERIREGQIIRVDGSSGRVELA